MSRCAIAIATLAAAASLETAPLAAQVTDPSELRYPPLSAFSLPQPERIELDNGMVVLLLPDHELPLVEVRALVHAGPRYDPADKVGLATLAAELMRTGGTAEGGRGSLSADALDDYLESHAATIELSVDDDQTWARLSTLASDFPAVLAVFADVLHRPALDASRLELARAQQVAALARSNDDAAGVLLRETKKRVYGETSPLARTPSYASLRSIGRGDVVAWHRASLHPDRMVLGVVGDFRRDETLALLRAVFGDWPQGPPRKLDPPAFQARPRPGVYFAPKDDSTQSSIGVAHLGMRFDDPDYYAAELLNQLFAGGFGSRLVTEVRTRQALGYDPWGGIFSSWDRPGIAGAFLSTKVATTGRAIDALLAQVRDLTTRPPTADEVEKARQGLLASFVFLVDTPGKVMRRQLLLEHYGYPRDWLARYQPGITAATVEDVRRVAARLRPADFAIVVVGPREGADQPLSNWGKVEEIDISLAPDPDAGGS